MIFLARFSRLSTDVVRLVARAAGLGDDTLELVNLLLGTAEGTELRDVLV